MIGDFARDALRFPSRRPWPAGGRRATEAGPDARTAIAAASALSTPPESPTTNPLLPASSSIWLSDSASARVVRSASSCGTLSRAAAVLRAGPPRARRACARAGVARPARSSASISISWRSIPWAGLAIRARRSSAASSTAVSSSGSSGSATSNSRPSGRDDRAAAPEDEPFLVAHAVGVGDPDRIEPRVGGEVRAPAALARPVAFPRISPWGVRDHEQHVRPLHHGPVRDRRVPGLLADDERGTAPRRVERLDLPAGRKEAALVERRRRSGGTSSGGNEGARRGGDRRRSCRGSPRLRARRGRAPRRRPRRERASPARGDARDRAPPRPPGRRARSRSGTARGRGRGPPRPPPPPAPGPCGLPGWPPDPQGRGDAVRRGSLRSAS